MLNRLEPAVVKFVRDASAGPAMADALRELLVNLCAIDTSTRDDVAAMAAGEAALFDRIEREVKHIAGSEARIQRLAIDPAIAADPDYTLPAYAADTSGTIPDVRTAYGSRGNLLVELPPLQPAGAVKHVIDPKSPPAPPLVLHAHVDTVPPWIPPRVEGQRIIGRGTCDNKGQVAVLLMQMQLIRELQRQFHRPAHRTCEYHFAIDEEIGGNGSLSLAMARPVKGASVLVAECTGLMPFCAHRGCVYYECRISTEGLKDISAAEVFPFIVLAMENEGRLLREEAHAPMFSVAHVQTNHGTLGCFGHSPGSVCDHFAVEVTARAAANPERIGMKVIEFLDEAMAEYIRLYGDKTKELDPQTHRPKVARHFDVKVVPGPEFHTVRIDVHGKGGHMGALVECDSAITKAAYLFAVLVQVARQFPGLKAFTRLGDGRERPAGEHPREGVPRQLVMRGGQGFTPSHTMADVQRRLTEAVERGVKRYCETRGIPYRAEMATISFQALHNDAYADSPESEPMQALRLAFEAMDEPWPTPVAWETSCDARIYHHKGASAAIFGAGRLEVAHSPDEYVDIADLQKALAITTLATWAML